MTTPAEDKEMAAFVAWAVKKYGQHAYRHTSATSGEWAAWQAARAHSDELRICALRALIAWDGTVLPKAHDGLMQERMEDLRAALAGLGA